tara:strand:- start:799 stop:1194 length:396 start_codon:yes stop_codon:yes gene_type:complete
MAQDTVNMGYRQKIGNPTKQVPGVPPDNFYERSKTPQPYLFSKTPNAVVVGTLNNHIGFFFGSSASFATTATTEGPNSATGSLTGSQHYTNFGKPAAGTMLNIHPTAWSGSSADAGNVVFVYSSGLQTGPY